MMLPTVSLQFANRDSIPRGPGSSLTQVQKPLPGDSLKVILCVDAWTLQQQKGFGQGGHQKKKCFEEHSFIIDWSENHNEGCISISASFSDFKSEVERILAIDGYKLSDRESPCQLFIRLTPVSRARLRTTRPTHNGLECLMESLAGD